MEIVSLMMATAMLAGASSCSTDPGANEAAPREKADVKLTFTFTEGTRAGVDQVTRPVTTWAHNIHSLAAFFVTNGIIKDARTIAADNAEVVGLMDGTDAGTKTKTLPGIETGTYDIHVIANYQAKPGLDNIGVPLDVTNCIGQNINNVLFEIKELTQYEDTYKSSNEVGDYTQGEGSKWYDEAPEVFTGVLKAQTISEGDNTLDKLNLSRIVSLVRVRIDPTTNAAAVLSDQIDFLNANASIRLRRTNKSANLFADWNAADVASKYQYWTSLEQTVFFAIDPFNGANPSAADGYTIVNNAMPIEGNYMYYADKLIFPAGNATENAKGEEKLDLVITGIVKAGQTYPAEGYPKEEPKKDDQGRYIDANGQVVADPADAEKVKVEGAPAGSQIVWYAAITGAAKENGILQVNAQLTKRGTWVDPNDPDKEVPEPGLYGNVAVTVDLLDWASFDEVNLPM